MANLPIVNQPFLYANNLQLLWVSTTTLTVKAGQCRDKDNEIDMTLAADTTLNGAVTGANGLDSGALANSTQYAVFVIADNTNRNPVATLLSTSYTAPYMPDGYSNWRRIGWVRTDSSAHFLKFYQSGNDSQRLYQYDVPISVLSAGTATTFAAVSLAAAVPLVAQLPVIFGGLYTPNIAASTLDIRPTGSTAAAGSTPWIQKGTVATVSQRIPLTRLVTLLATSGPSIDYQGSASDATTLVVVGFEDSL